MTDWDSANGSAVEMTVDSLILDSVSAGKIASIDISHSGAKAPSADSAVRFSADEVSYDGSITTVQSDRRSDALTGIVIVGGTSLVGAGTRFRDELHVGDTIVRDGDLNKEMRMITSVNSD